MDSEQFYVSEDRELTGQTVLLIDDVITTGTTIRRCGEALAELSPARLYALAICRT